MPSARLLGVGFLVAAVACGDSSSTPGPDADPDAPPGCGADVTPGPGVVVTTTGAVGGARAGDTWAYLGIPYAAPPVGERRFAPPAPAACWTGVRDATAYGAVCPQLGDDGEPVGDEDCLTVNVWSPVDAAGLPVMVWIHGGGNQIGSGTYPIYAGDRLAAAGDVVVVTINYRLGALGFLAHADLSAAGGGVSGNWAMLDHLAALAWVRDNAAAFGGDPDNVTIFGESAGGRNVCTLLAVPDAAGLFHRAIIQSGACKFLDDLAAAETDGAAALATLGCDDLACARQVDALALTAALATDVGTLSSASWGPVIDGALLAEQPEAAIRAGRHHAVPTIVGANADETSGEAPLAMTQQQYEAAVRAQLGPTLGDLALAEYAGVSPPRAAYVQLTSDARFICPSREITRALAAGAAPARRYFLTYDATPLGAVHGLDVPYVFGTFDALADGTYQPTAADLAISAAWQARWSRFAHTGDPDGPTTEPAWPAWPTDGATDPALVIDAAFTVEDGAGADHCDFWRPYYDLL